ncbi:hypothetical protein HYR99_08390 [Candidatus Poribacteria bacterium]|nr:hypothetical protein [Candidatus Poribacteria bacterium]
MKNKPHILVLDDDTHTVKEAEAHLNDNFDMKGVPTLDEAQGAFSKGAEPVVLPEWVKFALDMAKEIEEIGIELPVDLAEHHNYYAHGKPKS